jgi:hypothetical protein
MKNSNIEEKIDMKKEDKSRNLWANKGKRAAYGMMGLSIMLQNLAFATGDAFSQLKGMVAPEADVNNIQVVPDPAAEELRLSFSKSIPRHLQDQAMALCILAKDVISNPQEAGRRFSANPKAYLAERGITDIELDMNSREVKIVLALGDERVREAATKGDASRYLQLLEERGLLNFNIATAFGSQEKGKPDAQPDAACVVAVPVVFVAVVYLEIATIMHTYTTAYSGGKTISSEKGVLNGIEGKVTILLWGKEAAREMLSQHIAEKSDKWASAVSELPDVKAQNMSKDQIKKIIEKRMTEYLSE